MTVAGLKEEIEAIQEFINIINLEVANKEDYILRSYIETESLNKTKRMISHILKHNGNKYQLNDIRDLVVAGAEQADERVNDLAYRIYKSNKKTGRRR